MTIALRGLIEAVERPGDFDQARKRLADHTVCGKSHGRRSQAWKSWDAQSCAASN